MHIVLGVSMVCVFTFKEDENWRIVGGRGGFKYLYYIHNDNLCSFLPR